MDVSKIIGEILKDTDSREKMYVYKKHYVRFYLKEFTSMSLKDIAQATNARSHGTVINSLRVHNDLVFIKDKEYLSVVNELNILMNQRHD